MLLFYKGALKLGKQVQHNYVILYLEISIQIFVLLAWLRHVHIHLYAFYENLITDIFPLI